MHAHHTFYLKLNPLSTRPHQNVVWYNKLLIRFSKNSELCAKRKRKIYCKKWALICQLNVAMAHTHRDYFRQNNLQILKLATYTNIEDHYSRCKLATFLDWKGLPNIHILFRLHKTKFYWSVMKIKHFCCQFEDTIIEVYFLLGINIFWGLRSEWVKLVLIQFSIFKILLKVTL